MFWNCFFHDFTITVFFFMSLHMLHRSLLLTALLTSVFWEHKLNERYSENLPCAFTDINFSLSFWQVFPGNILLFPGSDGYPFVCNEQKIIWTLNQGHRKSVFNKRKSNKKDVIDRVTDKWYMWSSQHIASQQYVLNTRVAKSKQNLRNENHELAEVYSSYCLWSITSQDQHFYTEAIPHKF